MFLLLFAAVAIGAVAIVCLPLLRGARLVADRDYFDRAVYRDQLKEVERDVARGVLSTAEADSARLEIQRRLLAVDAAAPGRRVRSVTSPRLAVIVTVLVLAGTSGLYWRFGAPSLPDAPFTGQSSQPEASGATGPDGSPHLDMAKAAASLAEKLQADPSNAEGWELYARTESMLGDWQKAGTAYRHALDLGRKTPDVYSGYGEMLVLQADGIVSPAAHDAFNSALAIEPSNDVARYYLALADSQAGEVKRAIDRWLALAADIPDDSPMREGISRGVAEAAKAGGLPVPALPRGTPPQPQQDEAVAAPSQPNPHQQQAAADSAQSTDASRKDFIKSMVTQLAARLEKEPNDLDGWLRLGRSYGVLGETDKSVAAFERAVSLKPDDPTIKMQEFEALIGNLEQNAPLPPRAVELLQQVAAVTPDQPEVLWYLGVEAARGGKPDEARRDWTKLLGQLPAEGEDAKLVRTALDALPGK